MSLNNEERELLHLQKKIGDTIEIVAEGLAETKIEALKPVLLELLQVQRVLQARLRRVVVQQMVALSTMQY